MARQYSPRTFLRQVPNALLRRYLTVKQVGGDLLWDHLVENNIEPIYRAIETTEERGDWKDCHQSGGGSCGPAGEV